ncbi:MAG TPA: response regulator transcription factor [Moraxellaceae bacterium]|nr:response regulator transcription factor [Moraxellaceae bacterium]
MKIILVGQSDLQTDLLLNLLRQNVTPHCSLQGSEPLPADASPDTLFIVDLAAVGDAGTLVLLNAMHSQGLRRAALINVDSQHDQPRLAALPGVCGLFPRQASAEHFLRGVQAILAGEYWLPRHVLCTHLENTRQLRPAERVSSGIKLSPKERQLLALLSQGCSNDVIAGRLSISPHTVKTHFYNLYRKLRVRNRVQAATWAQQHSHELEAAS